YVFDRTRKGYPSYDGFNTFTILKTDYDNYIMFYLINKKDGETFQMMALYGQEPDLSSNIKEKFAKLSEEHGFVRENIIDLSNASKSGFIYFSHPEYFIIEETNTVGYHF
uniref:Lipocalin/cytosolic fatty-acid binding domain-containing protein n=1 Tax=Mus spicilegus TaxID=10103 RepID=A0A8C6I5D0_MUSSI